MAGTDEKSMSSPTFCNNGCGFYGSPNTEGLCSKCYRDLKKDDITGASNLTPTSAQTCRVENSSPMSVPQQPPRTPPVISTPLAASSSTEPAENVTEDCEMAATPSSALFTSDSNPPPSETQPALSSTEATAVLGENCEPSPRKKNRCGICNKKLGLTGFNCRCGGLYCSIHRYADGHDCNFDYKTDGKNAIRKANPKVDGEKVAKI